MEAETARAIEKMHDELSRLRHAVEDDMSATVSQQLVELQKITALLLEQNEYLRDQISASMAASLGGD